MERYTDHTIRGNTITILAQTAVNRDVKLIVSVIAIELAMLLFAASKGLAEAFLPVTGTLMVFSVITCLFTFYANADKTLTIIVLMLLNIGFLVQQIQNGTEGSSKSFLIKMAASMIAATAGTLFYTRMKDWFKRPFAIAVLVIAQYAICAVMIIYGQLIGSAEGQGARIQLSGITPFELVKVMYILTAAGLTGRSSRAEKLLLLHTVILSFCFVICSELGTLLIIWTVGILAIWMFGKHRKTAGILLAASGAGTGTFWVLSDKLLLPMITENPGIFPGVVTKLVSRFGAAVHPELYINGYGYQSIRGLQAISMGGWFGIETERYRMPLPECVNDFIFANVIQTCGLLIGFIVIILFLIFLRRGSAISDTCRSEYYRRVAFMITATITLEAIIHIGYNIAALPVTGIPLYFVSQGFTALTTGMLLTGMLLVISADRNTETELNYEIG